MLLKPTFTDDWCNWFWFKCENSEFSWLLISKHETNVGGCCASIAEWERKERKKNTNCWFWAKWAKYQINFHQIQQYHFHTRMEKHVNIKSKTGIFLNGTMNVQRKWERERREMGRESKDEKEKHMEHLIWKIRLSGDTFQNNICEQGECVRFWESSCSVLGSWE